MKGILHKTEKGWIVVYDEVVGENIVKKNQNALPLANNGSLNGLALYDSNEGLEVDFEIFIDFDSSGPEHFPKFARIITPEEDKMVTKCYCGHTSYCDCGPLPEEDELKDWDVTLNDGLDNEPYVSDDFQIGPDGAYEHTEDWNILPKEKAKELVDIFSNECLLTTDGGKVAALIAVDEIIKECYNWNGSDNVQWESKRFDYWNEVKQEIEKL
jgi:hypothetical protein